MLLFPGDDGRLRQLSLTTVDRLIEEGRIERPDLVKIDGQGMELEVLQGGAQLFDHAGVFIIFDLAGSLRRPFEDDLGPSHCKQPLGVTLRNVNLTPSRGPECTGKGSAHQSGYAPNTGRQDFVQPAKPPTRFHATGLLRVSDRGSDQVTCRCSHPQADQRIAYAVVPFPDRYAGDLWPLEGLWAAVPAEDKLAVRDTFNRPFDRLVRGSRSNANLSPHGKRFHGLPCGRCLSRS